VAVAFILLRLSPIICAIHYLDPGLEARAVKGNGLKQCNELLKEAEEGTLDANFMEGMGCPGGCVGGPGTVVRVSEGAEKVDEFAGESPVSEAMLNLQARNLLSVYGTDENLNSRKTKIPVPRG